ncbi:MAG: cation:proton antiporter [Victivallales bacterium]|nr:cation:proton antiporter [Victivallales bacterium]
MEMGLLIVLGLAVFLGMIGAWLFQKIRFPQVVGYIVIGLIIGQAGFGVITQGHVEKLGMFNNFALGIIGFLVGGELKIEMFRKYGRQFTAILLGEGIVACTLVGIMTGLVLYYVTGEMKVAVAGGVVFGAIASATDPASTIDVLWEYRAQGIMTSSIIAIVALDDALAMTLYGIGTSTAQLLTGGSGSVANELLKVGRELGGALIVGTVAAFILAAFMKRVKYPEKLVSLAVGMILLIIGISVRYHMDVILAGMMMGFVLVNFVPHRSEELFKLLRSFSIPIYVIFFVLVGARLGLGQMTWWIWVIVLLYVLGRSAGKMYGARLGAIISRSPEPVKKYLGMSIFAQGGVAVGLSIVAAQHLKDIKISEEISLGDAIIYAVTATTLIVQFVGPAMVKLALKLSGEAGRNITDEDVMETMTVADVIEANPVMLQEHEPLQHAINMFRDNDKLMYPVLREDKLIGVLSFETLKSVLADRESWRWLVVADVMTAAEERATPDSALTGVYELMQRHKIDQMPVISADDKDKPLGIIDLRGIKSKVHSELIRRRSTGSDAVAQSI